MKKLAYFLGGWAFGIAIMNKYIYSLMLESIKNESAVAILTVIITCVYTIVLSVVVTHED